MPGIKFKEIGASIKRTEHTFGSLRCFESGPGRPLTQLAAGVPVAAALLVYHSGHYPEPRPVMHGRMIRFVDIAIERWRLR